jgi:hypothetical protein
MAEIALHSATDVNDLLNSFAVVTHMDQGWQYENAVKTVEVLKDLGITHIREGFVGLGHRGAEHAAQQGIRFTVNIGPGANFKTLFPRLEAWVRKYPGSIAAIEGPNEVNNWPVKYEGKTGIEGAQAFQRDLYAGVKSRPALKDIPVVGVTSWPVFQNDSDLGNIHAYDRSGNFLTGSIIHALKDEQAANPGKKIWMTEAGYHTRLGNDNYHEGVSESVQAKMALSMYFSAFQLGVLKTFYYQLANQYTDPKNQESYFGLVDLQWNPKPAYHALKNLKLILRQGGDGPAPDGSLGYGFDNLPSTGRHKLFRVADGDWLLAVWNEPDIWDEKGDIEIENPIAAVTLRLRKASSAIRIFDPLTGVEPIRMADNTNAVTFDLDDRPVLLRIRTSADASEAPGTPRTSMASLGASVTPEQPTQGDGGQDASAP